VDRLLKSPASQRGRDFSVMLATFRDLDYNVEWRVINAADYGFKQRRRRVFIFAYKKDGPFAQSQCDYTEEGIVLKKGFFAKSFKVRLDSNKIPPAPVQLDNDPVFISDNFSFNFCTAGIMKDGKVFAFPVVPDPEESKETNTLRSILIDENKVDDKFYLTPEAEEKFKKLRGAKRIERTTADGHKYIFSEGSMSTIDELDKPGRTMLTSEGSINRSTHIVEVNGRKRFLTPLECERMNGFKDDWTVGMTDRMRYFCMGNALVVGLIEEMGKRILEIEKTTKPQQNK